MFHVKPTTCTGCGAAVPDVDAPTHAYIRSSPGCWRLYGEVLGRQYGEAGYGAASGLTVDAYAAQHPHDPGRRNRQSVAVHLISLCLVLEHDLAPYATADALRRHVDRRRATGQEWPWLTPPASLGAVSVADVHAAADAEEHVRRVDAWARSVWEAWSAHHPQVRAWASSSSGGRAAR